MSIPPRGKKADKPKDDDDDQGGNEQNENKGHGHLKDALNVLKKVANAVKKAMKHK